MKKRYLKYDNDSFSIFESRDNKHHIFIKDHHGMFIMWIGYKGLIPGSAMKKDNYLNKQYVITGIDNVE